MKVIKTVLLGVLTMFTLNAQQVEINDVYPKEVASKGFSLSQDASIKITGAAGVFRDDWRSVIYYAWILDSETREVVWHLLDDTDERDFRYSERSFEFDRDVDLKKGNYELYFTGAFANNNGNFDVRIRGFRDIVDQVFDSGRRRRYRSDIIDDLHVKVESRVLSEVEMNDLINSQIDEAVISFMRVGDREDKKKGFNLTKETKVRVYVIGEGTRDQVVDHAWIQNMATRERVFDMTYRNTNYAGGAEKNIKIDKTITLPAGSYMLKYSSDDSHSFDEWNDMPPDDPEFWGINVWPATETDRKNFAPYVKPKEATPVLALTQVRDDVLMSKGMTIAREVELNILCIGEGTDDMVDYGWITNAKTREKVWEMKEYRTEHAGGAEKNRMVEERITLPPGDYIVYYVTDDSHSYRDWNAAKPYDEDLYGISVWAIKERDMNLVKTFDANEYKNEDVIAELVRVGNNEDLRESFEIDQDTKVRIIAVSEGSGSEMDDYGYIKNVDTGRIVWEMRYRESDHAGGARKNREFNEILTLERGRYRIYFESDGSHSYRRWNADPPRNPELWGISVLKND